MTRKEAAGEILMKMPQFPLGFFPILASQIKSPLYCTLLLCTVMPLLPLWLLLKHLTTVIVLYINYTP